MKLYLQSKARSLFVLPSTGITTFLPVFSSAISVHFYSFTQTKRPVIERTIYAFISPKNQRTLTAPNAEAIETCQMPRITQETQHCLFGCQAVFRKSARTFQILVVCKTLCKQVYSVSMVNRSTDVRKKST